MSAARRAFGDLKNVGFTPMDAKSAASGPRKVQDGSMKSQQRAKNIMDAFATPHIKGYVQDLNKNAGRLSDDPDMRCSYLQLKDDYRDCIARERELSKAPLKPEEILEDDFLSCDIRCNPFDQLVGEEFRLLRTQDV